MKKILNNVLFKTIFMMILFFFLTGFKSYNIDLSSCSPDGVFQNLKEKISPLEFWIDVHVELEMDISSFPFMDVRRICSRHDEPKDRFRCENASSNRYESMKKCLYHAAKMCRLNGGLC